MDKFENKDNIPFPSQRHAWYNGLLENRLLLKALNNNHRNRLCIPSDVKKCLSELAGDKSIENADVVVLTDFAIMHNWALYKQIYRYDIDLVNLLSETEISELPAFVLKNNLPYDCFFVDLPFTLSVKKDDEIIRDKDGFYGFYVQKFVFEDGATELVFELIHKTDELEVTIIPVPIMDSEIFTMKELLTAINENKISTHIPANILFAAGTAYAELVLKLMKLVIYLCSSEQDIEVIKKEIADTQSTEKKTKPNKKRKKTVNQNNIGYRIGKAIRQSRKVYEYSNKSSGTGTKKTPHMRKAHYHHFWTGSKSEPESRKLVVKLISPVFVNGYDQKATIHKVKK